MTKKMRQVNRRLKIKVRQDYLSRFQISTFLALHLLSAKVTVNAVNSQFIDFLEKCMDAANFRLYKPS